MPLESDKKGGLKYPISDVIPTGMYPTSFARKIPLWKDGSNVIFTKHGVEKEHGWTLLADPGNGEPFRGFMQNLETSGTEGILYAGDLSSIYRIEVGSGDHTTVGSGFSLIEDSGSAVWDSGTSTWDVGATLWDFGSVKASQWSFVPFGEWVLATYGSTPLIRKGIGDFVGMYGGVTGITIVSGGTGYTAGDVLTLTGGDGAGATATVVTVDGGGVITSIGMTSGGTGFTTVPTGFTGGTGTTASFSFTICDIDVSTVDIFVNSGPHILGFNTSASSKEFIWCDADDPDTWVSAADNLAGQLEIRELQSPIRAVVPLGSRLAVYGDNQMFLVSYLGNDLVFGYQPAVSGIGAVSKNSIVSIGRQNLGLSQEGFFLTDGATSEYIDEPAVREWFTEMANTAQLSKAVGFHDETHNQVKWFFPTGENTITGGLSLNYKTGAWAIITAPFSACDERQVGANPFLGSNTGVVYKAESGFNDGDNAITAWVRSKPLDLDNADIIKELDSIRVGYTGAGLTYRIGWSEEENGTINWGDYVSMDTGFPFHNIRTAGRWLHFELYSNSLNANWAVAAVEFIGRTEGTR